jgi:hypothetical protein
MMYPNKKKVLIRTFIETDEVMIDKDINEFRDSHEVIAIQTNFVLDSKDKPLFHYVVFYYEDTPK